MEISNIELLDLLNIYTKHLIEFSDIPIDIKQAIPALNEGKTVTNNSAEQGLIVNWQKLWSRTATKIRSDK